MKIAFRFNQRKTIEVVLYILNKLPHVSHQKIQHLIFDADIYHLNIYIRPILGDEYSKEGKEIVAKNIASILAQSKELNAVVSRCPDLCQLSISDRNALDRTLRKSEDQLLSIHADGIIDYEYLIIDEEAKDFLKDFSLSIAI